MTKQTITDIDLIAEKALHLYLINRDPLTLSAAKLLLKVTKLPLTEPQSNALVCVQKQLDAYQTLYTEPLM